ncbi:branched-chain amino acid ABC transporter permease [Poseidonocella sp. HB161398]|uniref:branched-chain amino acid ABC transporter permease n=1 Tax=Poseidonocella sp. HB161398 TaxID=2320855 RepID=UPI00110915F4|nr:branched-chain amino acid ABC transporter permease [Poseidonocella sp. HB161398]
MKRDLTFILCALAVLAAAGLALDPGGYAMRILCLVFLTAAMAQSWNIMGGLAAQISLGHAAFFGIGAYASTILQVEAGLSPWIGMWIGMVLAVAAAMLLALPTVRLRGHYLALATLAFAEACRVIANSIGITGGPQGISVPYMGNSPAMMQFSQSGGYLPVIGALFALVFGLFALISRSRLGYMLRAIRENEDAAELSGVSAVRVKIAGFAISAALSALCGTVFAQFMYFFDPDSIFSPLSISVRMALVAIIGGLATLSGPLWGAVVLVVLEETARSRFSALPPGVTPLLVGSLLIATVLWRPAGIVSLLPAPGGVRPGWLKWRKRNA